MKSSLNRIKGLIKVLPGKDLSLATEFLNNRNFQGILELVESDIYKAEKKDSNRQDNILNDYIIALAELRSELLTYMSYLGISEYDDNYNFD